jgi:hypothetical protein
VLIISTGKMEPCENCYKGAQVKIKLSGKELENVVEHEPLDISPEDVYAEYNIPEEYQRFHGYDFPYNEFMSGRGGSLKVDLVINQWKRIVDALYKRVVLPENFFFYIFDYVYYPVVVNMMVIAKQYGLSCVPYISANELLSLAKATFGYGTDADIAIHKPEFERIGFSYVDYVNADFVAIEITTTLNTYPFVSNTLRGLYMDRARYSRPTYLFSTVSTSQINSTSFFLSSLRNLPGKSSKLTVCDANSREKKSEKSLEITSADINLQSGYNRPIENADATADTLSLLIEQGHLESEAMGVE